MNVLFSRSIGTLAHLYLIHAYRQNNGRFSMSKEMMEEFVEICDQFDQKVMPDGPGSFRRAGVIALAEALS